MRRKVLSFEWILTLALLFVKVRSQEQEDPERGKANDWYLNRP